MLNGHQLEVLLMTQSRPCWRSLQVSVMKLAWPYGLPTGSSTLSSLRAGDRGQGSMAHWLSWRSLHRLGILCLGSLYWLLSR